MRLFRCLPLSLILLLAACSAQPTQSQQPTEASSDSPTPQVESTSQLAATDQPTQPADPESEPTEPPLVSEWQKRSAVMPSSLSEMPAALIDGMIYVVGGFDANSVLTDALEVYDPQTDSWSTRAPLPEKRHHVMTAGYDGKLYVFGGILTQQALSTAWVYDPATDVWASIAPLPEVRASGAAVTLGDYIYIVGGTGSSRALLRYNPASDSWDKLASLQQSREHNQAVVLDGKIYALGGRWFPGVGDLATTEIYDPASDTWTYGPVMLEPHTGFGAAVIDDRIYIAGGEVFGGGRPEALVTVEYLDLNAESWVSAPSLPTPLHGMPMVAVDGTLYILGGSIQAAAINNHGEVYAYQP